MDGGDLLGAVIATCFHPNWIIYGVGIFLCGMLMPCSYHLRFAASALSIVLLITHDRPPWIVAIPRFIETSVGIAVAVLVTVAWALPSKPNLTARLGRESRPCEIYFHRGVE